MLRILEKIARSPYLSLVSGIVLLVTAGWQIVSSFGEGGVGAHHGVAFYGLVQIIRSFPEIVYGAKDILPPEAAH